ncbi:MAG: hypothetical protein H6825_10480 [Planctomycetes bacterium]|nr:hypothetical protein [Planctomycetota bacterium]
MAAANASRSSWPPLTLALVALLGVAGLIHLARGAMDGNPRFLVDPSRVRVDAFPDWMPVEVAQRLAAQLGEALGGPVPLLDEHALDAWRQTLPATSDWIESVDVLEPSFPGQARATLRLRRPVLTLPGDLLVSADGRTLGRGQVEVEPRPLLFVGTSDPAAVRECAAAAAEILPFRARIDAEGRVAIDRVSRGDDGRVRFLTTRGVEIEWGRSLRSTPLAVVDLPPERRVENLMAAIRGNPGLYGVWRVTLWKEQPEVFVSD